MTTEADTAEQGDSPAGQALTGLLRPHRLGLAAVLAFQIVSALGGLIPLIAVVELGRALLRQGPVDEDHVWAAVTVGAIGLLVRVLFGALSSGIGHLIDGELQLSVRRLLAEHLGRVPLGWYSRRSSGELNQVVQSDVGDLHPLTAHTPGEIASAIVVPLTSLVYLFLINWRLTLVALAPVLLGLVLNLMLMSDKRRRDQLALDGAMGRIAGSAVEFVEGISVVKAFGASGRAHRAFIKAADDFADYFLAWVRGVAALGALASLVLSPPFVLVVILTGGAALITTDAMPPADLLPFLLLGLALTAPVAALGHGLDDVQAAQRAAGRIQDLLRVPPLPEPARPVAPSGHRVELRDVCFSYEPGHEVLRGIDLVLEPGTVTALVGASGGGKSTLAQLLPRFLDPTRGTVSLGGVDLRDIASRDLYRLVSFVFQDVRLLRASVADNIALAVPRAGREDVVRAARLARIHERILELPCGYDSVIGEDAGLSGGEAQRISIARALLADAPVLVLDEATAFADPRTERDVRRALDTLRENRTQLVIAHRLETIAEADTVVVLEDGVVSERGTPAELLATEGRFAAMWEAQQTWPDDALQDPGTATKGGEYQ
ncbi:ABC transporter ATP-binding protein [Streptomyces kronopolitis]|uniref:ABC transporter ATP-binding protein n=1 Tax=Streptomyces kronopolitis TaxID=1612435 RepID=UPI0020C09FBD|nr:ABC transporter ATP-binding protein [Streptomyces kronopolitis]MCL6296875.1 ABC transporter ATP-binding protein/permease [Streptomyces kronopolitis]